MTLETVALYEGNLYVLKNKSISPDYFASAFKEHFIFPNISILILYYILYINTNISLSLEHMH